MFVFNQRVKGSALFSCGGPFLSKFVPRLYFQSANGTNAEARESAAAQPHSETRRESKTTTTVKKDEGNRPRSRRPVRQPDWCKVLGGTCFMKNHATCVSLCGKKKDTSVFRRETLLLHVLYMRRRVYRTVLLTSRLHVDSGQEHIRVVCVYITRRARKSHSVVFP